jgi:SAM-dependent methyltransferase
MSAGMDPDHAPGERSPSSFRDSVRVTDAVGTQDNWFKVGATEKANSVIRLTRDLEVREIVEIGCGTGAILEELDRRGYGENYFACEPSRPLFEQLRSKSIPKLRESVCAPFDLKVFGGRRFDLAIVSHVLEHLINPARLLDVALERSSFVVAEVPIEGSPMGNLRARLRTLITGKPRTANATGHVQFFSQKDVHRLARWCGAEVTGKRLYSPTESIRFLVARSKGKAAWSCDRSYHRALLQAEAVVGPAVWAKVYYGHYAVLPRRRRAEDVDSWRHEFYPSPDL